MSDQSQLPQPFPLQPFFQTLGLCGIHPGLEGSEKEKGVMHNVVSLFPIGLLVVAEQESHLPRGQRGFGKVLRKRLGMLRHCARNRREDSGRRPGRDRPFSDQLEKIFRKGLVESQSPRDPPLFPSYPGGNLALGEMGVIVKLP